MFDIVVFGATGFTGKFVVSYLQEHCKGTSVAVAGRSAAKLEHFKLPVIVADVSDPPSLSAMCKQARVLLNCVGPYRFYGDAVVAACLEGKCHYLDISGEPAFIETVAAKYNAAAQAAGLTFVSACGFDSVPADLGTIFACSVFPAGVKPVNIESYLTLNSGPDGFAGHFATFECAVYGFGTRHELVALRRSQKDQAKLARPPFALPR